MAAPNTTQSSATRETMNPPSRFTSATDEGRDHPPDDQRYSDYCQSRVPEQPHLAAVPDHATHFPYLSADFANGMGGEIRLRLRGIILNDVIYFFGGHLPRNVAHLLADVVVTLSLSKGLQLSFDVSGGLPLQPRSCDLVIDGAVTGPAGWDVAQGSPVDRDHRGGNAGGIARWP